MKSWNLFWRWLRHVAAQSCVHRILLNIWSSCKWSINWTRVVIHQRILSKILLLLIAPLGFSKVCKIITGRIIQVINRTVPRRWVEFLFHFIIINFNQTQNSVRLLVTSHHYQILVQLGNTALQPTFQTPNRHLISNSPLAISHQTSILVQFHPF
jgi:hypothetical protein